MKELIKAPFVWFWDAYFVYGGFKLKRYEERRWVSQCIWEMLTASGKPILPYFKRLSFVKRKPE